MSINKESFSKIKAGAKVTVFEKVKEGDKERISQFSGMVIARKHGSEIGATFTVRTTLAGVGVEKVFPLHSTKIQKIEIISSPKKVSRSKIYYVRNLSKKQTRQKIGFSE
jgi:large subunit ribosomal protein L19